MGWQPPASPLGLPAGAASLRSALGSVIPAWGGVLRAGGTAQERRPLGKQLAASSRWVAIQASVPSSRSHTLSQLLLAEHRAGKKTFGDGCNSLPAPLKPAASGTVPVPGPGAPGYGWEWDPAGTPGTPSSSCPTRSSGRALTPREVLGKVTARLGGGYWEHWRVLLGALGVLLWEQMGQDLLAERWDKSSLYHSPAGTVFLMDFIILGCISRWPGALLLCTPLGTCHRCHKCGISRSSHPIPRVLRAPRRVGHQGAGHEPPSLAPQGGLAHPCPLHTSGLFGASPFPGAAPRAGTSALFQPLFSSGMLRHRIVQSWQWLRFLFFGSSHGSSSTWHGVNVPT